MIKASPERQTFSWGVKKVQLNIDDSNQVVNLLVLYNNHVTL